MDAWTHEVHTWSFTLFLCSVSKHLVTSCEQLFEPRNCLALEHQMFSISHCIKFAMPLLLIISINGVIFVSQSLERTWQRAEDCHSCTGALLSALGGPVLTELWA